MSDVYREIMEEGEKRGEQRGALQMVAQVLMVRFPTNTRDLDALIGRCTMDDLHWLIRELVTAESFAAVKRSLEARLAGR